MLGISQRKYAESRKARGLTGGSQAAVSKAVAAGRIHTLADRSIDPAMADAEWAANTSEVMQRPAAAPPAPPAAPVQPVQPALPLTNASKSDAERELTELKVERQKIALARDKSEVIEVALVEEMVGELITSAQSRLLLVAHKIGDELARLKDPIACRNVVEHAIREALEELSQCRISVSA